MQVLRCRSYVHEIQVLDSTVSQSLVAIRPCQMVLTWYLASKRTWFSASEYTKTKGFKRTLCRVLPLIQDQDQSNISRYWDLILILMKSKNFWFAGKYSLLPLSWLLHSRFIVMSITSHRYSSEFSNLYITRPWHWGWWKAKFGRNSRALKASHYQSNKKETLLG